MKLQRLVSRDLQRMLLENTIRWTIRLFPAENDRFRLLVQACRLNHRMLCKFGSDVNIYDAVSSRQNVFDHGLIETRQGRHIRRITKARHFFLLDRNQRIAIHHAVSKTLFGIGLPPQLE